MSENEVVASMDQEEADGFEVMDDDVLAAEEGGEKVAETAGEDIEYDNVASDANRDEEEKLQEELVEEMHVNGKDIMKPAAAVVENRKVEKDVEIKEEKKADAEKDQESEEKVEEEEKPEKPKSAYQRQMDERRKWVASRFGEDPDSLVPVDKLYEVCEAVRSKYIKQDPYGLRTSLNGPREHQVELKELLKKHIKNPRFMDILSTAEVYQFKFHAKYDDKGLAELMFEDKTAAAKAAIGLREFKNLLSPTERFRIFTYYGTFERDFAREERQRVLDEQKKRYEEKKKLDEERRKKDEERRKEMARKHKEAQEERRKQQEAERERLKQLQEEEEERMREEAERKADLDKRSIYVDDLTESTNKQDLDMKFMEATRITMPLKEGKCKGHAYLEFTSKEEVDEMFEKYSGGCKFGDGDSAQTATLYRLPLGVGGGSKIALATHSKPKPAATKVDKPEGKAEDAKESGKLNSDQSAILKKALSAVEKGSPQAAKLQALLSQVNSLLDTGDEDKESPAIGKRSATMPVENGATSSKQRKDQ